MVLEKTTNTTSNNLVELNVPGLQNSIKKIASLISGIKCVLVCISSAIRLTSISQTQGYMNYCNFTLKSPAVSDCIADHKQQ